MAQKFLRVETKYADLDQWLCENRLSSLLLVCGRSLSLTEMDAYWRGIEKRLGIQAVRFSDFLPNPSYESVLEGKKLYLKQRCNGIVAIGGGSAMDVAKCIKLYLGFAGDGADGSYLKQSHDPAPVPLLAIPTTAGSGAESTRYAVIYYGGEKQSVTHEGMIPEAVLLDCALLKTLPVYQRKSTMLDALCHGIESFWSVHSTEESRLLSDKAIRQLLQHREGYLGNTAEGNEAMLHAANLAGQAINITQTTAGHAMSYKLTGLFGISHGHAAALCVRALWPWMLAHPEKCVDKRGRDYLQSVFAALAKSFGASSPENACDSFSALLEELELEVPRGNGEELELLVSSVNPVRLKNNPVSPEPEDIRKLYSLILRE